MKKGIERVDLAVKGSGMIRGVVLCNDEGPTHHLVELSSRKDIREKSKK